MTKIKKISKIAFIITKIAKVFTIIGMCGVFVGMVILISLPNNLVELETTEVSIVSIDFKTVLKDISEIINNKDRITDSIVSNTDENATISDDGVLLITENKDTSGVTLNKLGISMIGLLIYLGGAFVVLLFVGKLTKNLRDGITPFSEENIKYLKTIGYSLLGFAVAPSIVGGIIYLILDVGQKYQISYIYNFNLTTVLVGVLFLALIYIFEYGAKLQKESDETL